MVIERHVGDKMPHELPFSGIDQLFSVKVGKKLEKLPTDAHAFRLSSHSYSTIDSTICMAPNLDTDPVETFAGELKRSLSGAQHSLDIFVHHGR